MSRLLRHGPNDREPPLALNLEEGGSISAISLLEYQTFKRLKVANAEVLSIAQERDSSGKLRFDLTASEEGARARCFQGHTLVVSHPETPGQDDRQRYLNQATSPESDRPVLAECMNQPGDRRGFRFVELSPDARQAKYIVGDKRGRAKRVWLILDTKLASSLGYKFKKLPNGVVVSEGINSHMHRAVFVSV